MNGSNEPWGVGGTKKEGCTKVQKCETQKCKCAKVQMCETQYCYAHSEGRGLQTQLCKSARTSLAILRNLRSNKATEPGRDVGGARCAHSIVQRNSAQLCNCATVQLCATLCNAPGPYLIARRDNPSRNGGQKESGRNSCAMRRPALS